MNSFERIREQRYHWSRLNTIPSVLEVPEVGVAEKASLSGFLGDVAW